MPVPFNLDQIELDADVHREKSPGSAKTVLWLMRGGQDAPIRRISLIPDLQAVQRENQTAVPAKSIPVRPAGRGLMRKLFRFGRDDADADWVLPDGRMGNSAGPPRTDMFLVWSADRTAGLAETDVRRAFGAIGSCERLGKNLLLVEGLDLQPAAMGTLAPPAKPTAPRIFPQAPSAPPESHPGSQAERFLAEAQASGDPRRVVAALIDVGVIHAREKNHPQALSCFEQALALARQSNDVAGIADALSNSAVALVALKQPHRALDNAIELNKLPLPEDNLHARKTALDVLGFVRSAMKSPQSAIESYKQALEIAQRVGDVKHQTELHWHLAIQHAEIGDRVNAVAHGRAAVELWRQAGDPFVDSYADYLRQYETGSPTAIAPDPPPTGFGYVTTPGMETFLASQPSAAPTEGPTLLRMALSAASAVGKFIGSGMRPVSEQQHRQRLEVCNQCEHHTGIRCRVCGCFTNVKTWLPHERCPAGKWT